MSKIGDNIEIFAIFIHENLWKPWDILVAREPISPPQEQVWSTKTSSIEFMYQLVSFHYN